MPVAAAIVGAAAIGGATSIISGNKAAKAQQQANNAAIAEQRRQYEQDRADYAPWRSAGEGALGRLTGAMAGNQDQFKASPGYDFRLSQGVQAAERSAAARGLLGSGATMKAVQRYGEGLASSEYNNWFNQNLGLAGLGQNAVNNTVNAGQNATNNITNLYQSNGNARASSYANTGSSINQGINNALSAYLYSRGGGFGNQPIGAVGPYGTPPYAGNVWNGYASNGYG